MEIRGNKREAHNEGSRAGQDGSPNGVFMTLVILWLLAQGPSLLSALRERLSFPLQEKELIHIYAKMVGKNINSSWENFRFLQVL